MTVYYDDIRKNLISMLEELDERLTTITHDVSGTDETVEKKVDETAAQNKNHEMQYFFGD